MLSINSLAPIALFVYNRPEHSQRTIEALQKSNLAKDSELFIFCDGPKNERDLVKVQEVHKIVEAVSGFKNVVVKTLSLNRGLANSVMVGVGEILKQYDKVIVLEDDIVTSVNFLNFINQGLEFYRHDKTVFSVTGFNYQDKIFCDPNIYQEDIFFIKGRASSLGWGIWKDRWDKVDFSVSDYIEFENNSIAQKAFDEAGDNLSEMLRLQMSGKIDSWAIRVAYHCFKYGLYNIFPTKSLVNNIGFDGSGTHYNYKNSASVSEKSQASFGDNKINFNFKFLSDIKNNDKAAAAYIAQNMKKKNISSKKNLLRGKYFLYGFALCALLHFLYRIL